MKKILSCLLLVFLLLSTISCEKSSTHKSSKPPELIEILKIDRTKENIFQLSDLFYAESYNIKFNPVKDIKISFDEINNQIKLQPEKNFSGLKLILFTNNDDKMVLPIIVKEKVSVQMELKPPKPTKKVWIMGSFNTWSRRSLEMFDPDRDGIFTRELLLDAGVYEYQFVTDYGEFPDPQNPDKVDNGFGSYNSLIKVKSIAKDQIPNTYILQNQKDHELKFVIDSKHQNEIKVHILANNDIFDKKYYTVKENFITVNTKHLVEDSNITIFRIITTYKGYPGNIITVWTKNGKILKADEFIWQDAVIYSLMTDRFANGNKSNDNPINHAQLAKQANFNGGDFQGIINKIQSNYFEKIGINTIWISPVNKTTNSAFQEWPEPHRWFSGYHGYWPTEPRQVEPRFGTLSELQNLVKIAHQHDIKILLDFVSNHTHIEHPYFQNHRDWYGQLELENGDKNIRLFDEYRLTTWFDDFLPSFDFINSQEAVNTITQDALWWIEQTNIDGFRHDATKHVPLKLWRNITRKIKNKIEPQKKFDYYQIGETFGSAELIKSYVNNGMLDSQFNFELFFTQRRVFAADDSDFRDVQMALNTSLDVYGYNNLMGNIFDSHDQTRMMALLEGDLTLSDDATARAWEEPKIQVDKSSTYRKQKALLTFILTIPGVPIIYYGDEFGMTGANDPDNRRMMRFDNELSDAENKQLDWNSKIFNLRTKFSSLRRGDYLPLYCDKNVMIYSRGDQNERLIIAINKSDEKQNINVKFPDWLDIKNPENVLVMNSILENSQFNLSAYSGNIWKCN